MRFNKIYLRYERKLGTVFEKYGVFVTKYPWQTIIFCVLLNCMLGIGLVRLKTENHVEKLYTPMNSRAFNDRERFKDLFPDVTGTNFFMQTLPDFGNYGQVILGTKDGSNILNNQKVLNEIQAVSRYIRTEIGVTNSTGNHNVWNDLCARDEDGKCVYVGELVFTDIFKSAMEKGKLIYPIFAEESLSHLFGNSTAENGTLVFASMMRMRFYVRTDTSDFREMAPMWEEKFLEKMNELETNLTNFAYENANSLNVELDGNTGGDIVFFSITFTIMLTYAGFATQGGDCISQRQNLGRAGVVCTVLAIIAAFGFTSAIGIEYVNIVGVMPFLIVGRCIFLSNNSQM